MSMIRAEDLGGMGESFFKSMCKSAGFITNKSDEDKGGWDFEIEHHVQQSINYSSNAYPVYRIQVKSTLSRSKQCRIKYSNLLKLIRYHGAAFVVLIIFNDDLKPFNAYIRHVDKKLSLFILKDIRKKQVRSSDFKLNKRYKVLKFTDDNAILPLTGNGLLKAIERNISGDYLNYVKNKIIYLKSCEEEGSKFEGTFTFKKKSELASFADCLLGFNKEFKMDYEMYNAPFGIRDEKPKSSSKGLVTTIHPNHNSIPNISLTLKNSQHGKEYRFSGKMYSLPFSVPSEIWATRIETALFEIVLRSHGDGFNGFQSKNFFNNDIKVSFRELYNFLSYLYFSYKSEKTYIKLESDSAKKPVEICLDKPISKIPNDVSFIYKAIESTYLRIREYNLDELEVSTKDIISNIGQCYCISILNKSFKPEYRLNFESGNTKIMNANVVIFNATVRFKGKSFVVFVAFFGSIKRNKENQFEGKFIRSQFLGEYIVDSDSIEKEEFFNSEENRFRIELTKQGYSVL